MSDHGEHGEEAPVPPLVYPGVQGRDRRPVPNRTGRSNVYTGAAKGYVDYKTFDQMAAELKA